MVVKALKKSDLPPTDMIEWCDGMLKSDRVGFIYRDELQTVRDHAGALRL